MSSYLKKKAHRKLTKEGNVKCPLNEPHHYSPLLLSPLPVLHKSTVFLLDSPCHNFFLCRSPTSVFPSLLRSLCRVVFTGLLRDGTTFWQGKKKEKHSWLPLRKTGNQDNPLLSGRISGLRLKERFNLQHVDWPRQKATMRKTLEQCVKTLPDLFFSTKSLYFI